MKMKSEKSKILKNLEIPKKFQSKENEKNYRVVFAIILFIFMVLMARNFFAARNSVEGIRASDRYEQCALWLREYSPEGSVVFHSSWDNFPELFFYNHQNYYLYGLAPDFMYVYDPEKYFLWDSIRRGEMENPSQTIKTEFKSSSIFVDNRYKNFEEKLNSDPNITKALHSEECRVYIIK